MKSVKIYCLDKSLNLDYSLIIIKSVIDGVEEVNLLKVKVDISKEESLKLIAKNLQPILKNSNIKIFLSPVFITNKYRFKLNSREEIYKHFQAIINNKENKIKLYSIKGTTYEQELLDYFYEYKNKNSL